MGGCVSQDDVDRGSRIEPGPTPVAKSTRKDFTGRTPSKPLPNAAGSQDYHPAGQNEPDHRGLLERRVGKGYFDCDDPTAMLSRLSQSHWQRRGLVAGCVAVLFVLVIILLPLEVRQSIAQVPGNAGSSPGADVKLPFPRCAGKTPCPVAWSSAGGGFFCKDSGGCRPGTQGPFPGCAQQCIIGNPPITSSPGGGPGAGPGGAQGGGGGGSGAPMQPKQLTRPGKYDLRVMKGAKLLGCAAPIGIFPGHPKYGCSGKYDTAVTCDAAAFPVKDTQYVKAVHDGCETALGQGTYGYAYDDGVGLKQCSPLTKYEWVLCPSGSEGPITWEATTGATDESTKRFRVTNRCPEPIWIAQAGPEDGGLPGEASIIRIEPGAFYTYSIPNRGLASTRFLPKTGCDASGNNCDIQSMPPCPTQGCDLPVDTKFEASWGCLYATGVLEDDKSVCTLTGQGNPSTYQDWWDGSAVDGWTKPFSILVDDGGHGLAPGSEGSPDICGPVVCAKLDARRLCPTQEFLTPEA